MFTDKNNDGLIRQSANESDNEVLSIRNYSPFGLELGGSHKNINLQNKYKFGGKEENGFTGYSDFGRRNFDASIGKFTTQDRYSEKYFDLGTMGYAANSPIKNIDINGDSLWIIFNSQKFLYDNGKLFLNDKEYKGKIRGFLADAYAGLNKIFEGGEAGKSLISDLTSSKGNISISSTVGEEGNSTTGLKVKWGSEIFEGGLDEFGNTTRPSFIGLGHELAHAQDYDHGTANFNTWYFRQGVKKPVRLAEKYATYIENNIRKENKLPLREYYTQDKYEPSRIIDSNKNNIFLIDNYLQMFR